MTTKERALSRLIITADDFGLDRSSNEAIVESNEDAEAKAAAPKHPRRVQIFAALPMVFTFGWLASMIAHAWVWNKPLGQ